MQFNAKILQNKRSWGLRSLEADNMLQAESHALALVYHHLNVSPQDTRWFYEVRTEELRRILLYARVGSQVVKLKVELREMA